MWLVTALQDYAHNSAVGFLTVATDLAWVAMKIVGIVTGVALVAILAMKMVVLAWDYPAASYALILKKFGSRIGASGLEHHFVDGLRCLWQARHQAYQGCMRMLVTALFIFDTVFYEWPEAVLTAVGTSLIGISLLALRLLPHWMQERVYALSGN